MGNDGDSPNEYSNKEVTNMKQLQNLISKFTAKPNQRLMPTRLDPILSTSDLSPLSSACSTQLITVCNYSNNYYGDQKCG